MVDHRNCAGLLNEQTDYDTIHSLPDWLRAELDKAGYQPTICPNPNYPTDENGYYNDPHPLIQRVPVAPECQAPVYERQAKVVHLKPPPPEPSGLLTMVEKCPRQLSPPPRKTIWCPSEPPPKPAPIVLRGRISEQSSPFAPRLCKEAERFDVLY
ncbi:unnamed protein product [Rotaria magnacalcarata]|uniref:Uncharacterized protein n=3 Tax=Rotaria magnacalcarata TaxID=392030 RepID=A0A819UAS8_9BILA|nr:unnamed protein product [Rotaria magnacalcarata]CAF2129830.1 unnamed protein product [Rotaria magnacalcarata]CAF4100260.1 unnamed protein product [Rotaria magnacalcarata]CAF4402229.1 unnamed protein product [Rotaria magnacalcarata]